MSDATEDPNRPFTPEETIALQNAGFKMKQKTLEERKVEALEEIAENLRLLVNAVGDELDVQKAGTVVANLDAIYMRLDRDS